MDKEFHVFKRISIYERVEIADARLDFEWKRKRIQFKEIKFREKVLGLLQLLAAGYKPQETANELHNLCNLHLFA